MAEETKTEVSQNGKTYTKKITALGFYHWILLFLIAVIAFGILATWIRLGSMTSPTQPYMAAIHGVYIDQQGKPQLRMVRVDEGGFVGVLPVQKGAPDTQRAPQSPPVAPMSVPGSPVDGKPLAPPK